jgi:hypothetical protein
MKNLKSKTAILLAAAALSLGFVKKAHGAITLTCYNQYTSGSWLFGTAPAGCNVTPSYSQSTTKYQYSPVIFNHSLSTSTARVAYMSKMYPLVRDVATYYMKRRKPTVSAAELSGWVRGIMATAHQETLWTHFRKPTDGIVRYMRGDNLHGHGMMQVDDRSHQAALLQGKGIDLVYNMMYGMDVYYAAWQKAATVSCASATNYRTRARASWSAYNGGLSRICRFATSPTTGDGRYASRYDNREWLSYVTNPKATTEFNVKCLVEGVRPCALLKISTTTTSQIASSYDQEM